MPEVKKEKKEPDNKFSVGYVPELGLVLKYEDSQVKVEHLNDGSDASLKGLKPQDVIVKINDKKVSELNDVFAYVSYAKNNDERTIKREGLSDGLPQTLNVSIKND